MSREVIIQNEISINENELEEIINILSEITNEIDLNREDELVSSYNNLRNQEQIKTPMRYTYLAFAAKPINYNDTINCMHTDKWKHATIEEIDSIHKINT